MLSHVLAAGRRSSLKWRMTMIALPVLALLLMLGTLVVQQAPSGLAAGLKLTLPRQVYTNRTISVSWSSSVPAHHFALIMATNPALSRSTVLANNIPGSARSYSRQLDTAVNYRYFQLQAYNAAGRRVATSNIVGVAKYPSGVMLQLATDAALTKSYATYNGTCRGYATPTWFVINSAATRSVTVSANFHFNEYLHNEPSAHVVVDPVMTQHVQNIRTHWGHPLTINSGYRTPLHNHNTSGSARCSAHTYGLAVDIAVPNITVWRQLRAVALRENPGYVEPWTPSQPHLHADWGPKR